MRLPTALLRSFGTAGALANVRAVLAARDREDWLVEGLVRRLEPAPEAPAPATARAAHPSRTRTA